MLRYGAIIAVIILVLQAATPANADIVTTCYSDCETETDSNPDFKACLARAADTADALLNQEFTALLEAVKAAAADMDVRPEAKLVMLKGAQRKWIGFRDDASRAGARSPALTGGRAAAGSAAG